MGETLILPKNNIENFRQIIKHCNIYIFVLSTITYIVRIFEILDRIKTFCELIEKMKTYRWIYLIYRIRSRNVLISFTINCDTKLRVSTLHGPSKSTCMFPSFIALLTSYVIPLFILMNRYEDCGSIGRNQTSEC